MPGDGGSPYDWHAEPEPGYWYAEPGFAVPDQPWGAQRSPSTPDPNAPWSAQPGSLPWQPSPAFTAAAAGMSIGPAAPDVLSWPAATGEPVEDLPAADDHLPSGTTPVGDDHDNPPGTPTGDARDTSRTTHTPDVLPLAAPPAGTGSPTLARTDPGADPPPADAERHAATEWSATAVSPWETDRAGGSAPRPDPSGPTHPTDFGPDPGEAAQHAGHDLEQRETHHEAHDLAPGEATHRVERGLEPGDVHVWPPLSAEDDTNPRLPAITDDAGEHAVPAPRGTTPPTIASNDGTAPPLAPPTPPESPVTQQSPSETNGSRPARGGPEHPPGPPAAGPVPYRAPEHDAAPAHGDHDGPPILQGRVEPAPGDPRPFPPPPPGAPTPRRDPHGPPHGVQNTGFPQPGHPADPSHPITGNQADPIPADPNHPGTGRPAPPQPGRGPAGQNQPGQASGPRAPGTASHNAPPTGPPTRDPAQPNHGGPGMPPPSLGNRPPHSASPGKPSETRTPQNDPAPWNQPARNQTLPPFPPDTRGARAGHPSKVGRPDSRRPQADSQGQARPPGPQGPQTDAGWQPWAPSTGGRGTPPAGSTGFADLPTPPDGGTLTPEVPRGPFVPPQPGAPAGPPPPKRKTAVIAAGAAVLVAMVGAGGYLGYQAWTGQAPAGNPDGTTAATQPAPEPPVTAQPDAGKSVLNSEETDPQALALDEAFPDKKVKVSGMTFTLVKTSLVGDCTKAATGDFAVALKKNACSRVLRATYVDSKKRYAVTTGIAVLPTRETAMQADKAKKLGDNIWFKPLPAKAGTGAERVHIAGGYASGLVWGRYVVFSYATNADGHTPTTKEKAIGKISGDFRDTTALVLERRITG